MKRQKWLAFARIAAMDSSPSSADLYWIPVGAGTRFQKASLVLYESVTAFVSRRPRQRLVHGGLVCVLDGEPFTVELMPAPAGPNHRDEVTGPVGAGFAGRLRLFRYQVCLLPNASLPDEQWAVEPPVRMTEDAETVRKLIEASHAVPAYTWGRRRPGHPEMWTSDSALAWILGRAGLHPEQLAVPAGCRAPGWFAGLAEAAR
ncbi:MAG: hypothetical protein U0837_06390 [Dehalococcoidia bacterium]